MSIFISYSRKDQDYVNKLVETLRKQELPWWLDNKIDYGDQWTKEIEENLKKCQVFLLVMSPNSKESDWVQRELIFAQQLQKPIFPLLLAGERWFQIINIQTTDVLDGKLPPDIFFNKIRSKLNIQTAQSTAEEMTEQLFDVFLAHNSVDQPQVRVIAKKLRERGLIPWLDEEQINAGNTSLEAIQNGLSQSKSAVFFIGLRGSGKWQGNLELPAIASLVLESKIRVIPVLLPGVQEIPQTSEYLFLKTKTWISLESIDNTEAIEQIQKGITQIKSESSALTYDITAVLAIMSVIFLGGIHTILSNTGLIASVLGWIFWLNISIFVVLFAWRFLTVKTSSVEIKPDDADAH
jgi:hypothetical protein